MPEISKTSPFTNGYMSVRAINNTTWVLNEPVAFNRDDVNIEVPTGFVTDLASVPRFCWWFISPWDIARASVIHDWLYYNLLKKTSKFERKECDEIFLHGMFWASPEVPRYKCYLAFYAVRLFGGLRLKFYGNKDIEKEVNF